MQFPLPGFQLSNPGAQPRHAAKTNDLFAVDALVHPSADAGEIACNLLPLFFETGAKVRSLRDVSRAR